MLLLRKQPERDFIILNLTDTQLSDAEWLDETGHNRSVLIKTVQELVARTQPDLITVTGDLAWAKHHTSYRMLGAFLDGFGIPWAPIWGNHDQQEGMEEVQHIVELYRHYPNFLYESGDVRLGNGNYVIGITQSDKLLAGLIMMDSHDRSPYINEQGEETQAWAKLTPPQLDWYEAQVRTLRQLGCESTALLLHIPIYAYRTAIEEWKALPSTVKTCDPSSGRLIFTSKQGSCCEDVASYPADEGMFARICALESTKLVIAGHDHINNTILNHHGVQLVYSLKTGPGCYWDKALNGGTVLTVKADGHFTVHHEYVSAE